MNRVYLLSGGVGSGKTTAISEWIRSKNSVGGILQPVINGKRYLQDISTGETRLLELTENIDKNDIISVGNYKFSGSVFNWAREKLISAFYTKPELLIIDEYGKLEINDRGLEPAISRIMNDLNDYQNINPVFIVRDYLVSEFLRKYRLNRNDIINLEI